MKLHELSPAEGSAKAAWRKGRGPGSGNGIKEYSTFFSFVKSKTTRFCKFLKNFS